MKLNLIILLSLLNILLMHQYTHAQKSLVVSQDGKGDFKSIQAAINSLPDSASQPRVIHIRNGVYNEKIYIEKHNIILKGESRDKTIITQSIARDQWRCLHNDDWGVATINVDGDDISLMRLTVINSFGFEWNEDQIIYCKTDSVNLQKKLTKNGHQMALRTMNSTRLKAVDCHFKSFGGDTVSPWNVENGMFYFKDCIMEGGVDLYCPRGWAYAENVHFIARSGSAAIWHDGSKNPDFKTVLKNCSFEGFDGFNLGRFHRDAQFYLINCKLPQNIADRDIYLVPTNNAINWGKRVYYHNTHRVGGDYQWHQNNLHTAPGNPDPSKINASWVFGSKWQPELEQEKNAHARLRKLNTTDDYGKLLKKEVLPSTHKPNDFTKQPIPYYQTEGPAWENDKVGFRLYLDARNAKDIFGKTTSAMVMDTIGTFGDKYYHYFDPAWGMDILKVGKSLGAGALALKVKTKSGKDTLVRLGDNAVEQTTYELIKDGPDEAIIRLHYNNWKVLDRTYNVTEVISIKSGNYFYESRITMNGLKGNEKLVTGIVNLKSTDSYRFTENGNAVLFTHDKQTENNDYLGMAVMVNKKVNPVFGETPKEGNGITNTYTVEMNVKNNEPVVFRFYAGWEKTDKRFSNKKEFQNMLKNEASAWSTSTTKQIL